MIVYLAAPYSHPRWWIRLWRFYRTCRTAARLMERLDPQGIAVFSPISHSHPISGYLSPKLRHDHELWMRQDLPILDHCAWVCVVRLRGWEKSRGVAREIAHAEGRGIPVIYIDPE